VTLNSACETREATAEGRRFAAQEGRGFAAFFHLVALSTSITLSNDQSSPAAVETTSLKAIWEQPAFPLEEDHAEQSLSNSASRLDLLELENNNRRYIGSRYNFC
jgi:hypothetical protein